MYIMIKNTTRKTRDLKEKRMFLTLLDTFSIILTQEKEKHYG